MNQTSPPGDRKDGPGIEMAVSIILHWLQCILCPRSCVGPESLDMFILQGVIINVALW